MTPKKHNIKLRRLERPPQGVVVESPFMMNCPSCGKPGCLHFNVVGTLTRLVECLGDQCCCYWEYQRPPK